MVIENRHVYEPKRYLEALIPLNKSRFWHIAFVFVEFVAFELAADLKYISLKKKKLNTTKNLLY